MDRQVFNLHRDLINLPFTPDILQLTAGEETKTSETVKHIYDFLAKVNADRTTAIFVIGGGTISDTAAYAVSTFKRGCRLVIIPSTLLGMVDAALGGKTAINHKSVKNQVGTFYPAEQVIIVPELLQTLPEAERQNGLAEMLKLRFILPDLPNPCSIDEIIPSPEIIMEYAQAKLMFCSNDFTDRGDRRLLNLGHSFGHTLESFTDYRISHGNAVAWGIAAAARVSEKLGFITKEICSSIVSTLDSYSYTTTLDSDIKSYFLASFPELVLQDKKTENNVLTLVLFKDEGNVQICGGLSLKTITDILPDCI